MMHKSDLKKKLHNAYANVVESLSKIKVGIKYFIILGTIYLGIDAFTNYDLSHFILQEVFFLLKILGIVLFAAVYHRLFGKWHVHENNVELTKEYVSLKIPRSMKVEGPRGGGKDTTVSGMVTTLREHLIESIEEEMDLIQTICYPYDFDKLNAVLDTNNEELSINVKSEFFKLFIDLCIDNNCFIKPLYAKEFSQLEHISELYRMKKDPMSDDNIVVKYKYEDGITRKHFLTLLLRYSLLYIRYHYMDNYIVANQPYKETETRGAIVFSTKFITIQQANSQWVWPLVGGCIIVETETDAFYPNVGGKESAMKSGIRNFKAFFRHLLGEQAIWIGIGQKAKRTVKTLRELDDSFVSIIELSKINGGEKRIFFLKKLFLWSDFWEHRSIIKRSRERQSRRKSKIIQHIKQLENTGFLYIDIKVSRSDEFTSPKQMSLRQILRYDKPIFENYTVKLCFRIKDSFGRFNSHYLEVIADRLAKKSKTSWRHLMKWDMDLTMKMKHIMYMDYKVMDDILQLEKIRKQLEAMAKKKKEKEQRDNEEEKQTDSDTS